MYTCGWFMLIYGKGQHSIEKQLSSKKKKKKNFLKAIAMITLFYSNEIPEKLQTEIQ